MIGYLQRKWRALGSLRRGRGLGQLSLDEVERRLGEPGFHVLDANWRALWRRGHLPGARHVEYDAFTSDDLPADRGATLVFYCHNAL